MVQLDMLEGERVCVVQADRQDFSRTDRYVDSLVGLCGAG